MNKIFPTNDYPAYGIKQAESVASEMLELWGMWSPRSLLSLLGPLSTGVVAPDRVLSMGKKELFEM